MKEEISDNLREIHGRIVEACEEYDRDADDITIVAITKTHPAAAIKMAVAAGIHNIGSGCLAWQLQPSQADRAVEGRYYLPHGTHWRR